MYTLPVCTKSARKQTITLARHAHTGTRCTSFPSPLSGFAAGARGFLVSILLARLALTAAQRGRGSASQREAGKQQTKLAHGD